jgi:hypothetical protein
MMCVNNKTSNRKRKRKRLILYNGKAALKGSQTSHDLCKTTDQINTCHYINI